MKKHFKTHALFDSVYTRFLFRLLLLAFIPIALAGMIFFYAVYQNAPDSKYEANHRVNNSIVNSIDSNLEYTSRITQSLLSSSELTSFLKKRYTTENDYDHYISVIQSYVLATMHADSRSDTFIYMENSTIPMSMDIFYHLSDIRGISIIDDFLSSDETGLWLCGADFSDVSNPYLFPVENRFIYLRKAYDYKKSFLGILVFSIPETYFLSFGGENGENEGTVISVGHSRIINLTGKTFDEKTLSAILSMDEPQAQFDSFFAAKKEPEHFPFSIITVTESTSYSRILLGFLLALACFAVFSVFLCLRSIKHLVSQMNQCLTAMDASISNNYKTRIPVNGRDEISHICERVNLLLNQAENLSRQNILKETSNKESRLIALQHQINPHFIYNTMEVFSSKMKLYGHYEESDAMVAFANIFRYNISTNDSLVTLQEELRQIHNYLNIQKLRHPGIAIEEDIPSELSFAFLPKFTFQPIIENAISHGITEPEQTLLISVTAEKRNGCLTVKITDNGAGMLPQQLDALNHSLQNGRSISTDGHSVGLKNVNARLLLYFGDFSRLKVDSRYGSYTTVSFSVPYQTKSGDSSAPED